MSKLNLFNAVPLIVDEQLRGYEEHELNKYDVFKIVNHVFIRTDLTDNTANRRTVKTMVNKAIDLMLNNTDQFNKILEEIEEDRIKNL
tara:strand:- start:884 stop:1147 length:264 start_codon:yes stop_codon:yes gene_type:complete